MLYKRNLENEVAVASQSGTIDVRNHFKNGSKNNVYEGNTFIKLILTFTLFCIYSFLSFGQQYESENNFRVEILSNGQIIINEYVGTNSTVRIPPTIQNRTVGGIGNRAFMKKNITSITIPDNVVAIGVNAFSFNKLTTIIIPSRVTHIGGNAFSGNNLTNVTIPDNVTIRGYAFSYNKITHITIGTNVRFEPWNFEGVAYNEVFFDGFDSFYISQGRRAGTYTFSNGRWSLAGSTTNTTTQSTTTTPSTASSLRSRAESGDRVAQYEMKLAATSNSQIIYWCRKAAENGHTRAQIVLAIYYEFAQYGLQKDFNTALYWYERVLKNEDGQQTENSIISINESVNRLRAAGYSSERARL